MDMHNSFTHLHQSSTALYYKFISCYFILWGEPCVFLLFYIYKCNLSLGPVPGHTLAVRCTCKCLLPPTHLLAVPLTLLSQHSV